MYTSFFSLLLVFLQQMGKTVSWVMNLTYKWKTQVTDSLHTAASLKDNQWWDMLAPGFFCSYRTILEYGPINGPQLHWAFIQSALQFSSHSPILTHNRVPVAPQSVTFFISETFCTFCSYIQCLSKSKLESNRSFYSEVEFFSLLRTKQDPSWVSVPSQAVAGN